MRRRSSRIWFPEGDALTECNEVVCEDTYCDAVLKCDESGTLTTLWEKLDDFIRTKGYVVTIANSPDGRVYALVRYYEVVDGKYGAEYNGIALYEDGKFISIKRLGRANLSIYTIHATDKAVFIGETTRESQYNPYPSSITWFYGLFDEEDKYKMELHPLSELQDGIDAFNQQDTIPMTLNAYSQYESSQVMDRIGIWVNDRLYNYAMSSYEAVEHNRIPFVKYGMLRGLSVVDVPRTQGRTQLDNNMVAYSTDVVSQEQIILTPREVATMFGVEEDKQLRYVRMELSKVRYGFERKNSYQPYVYNDKKQSRLYYCAYVDISYIDGNYEKSLQKSCVMSVGLGLDTSVDFILNTSSAAYNQSALRYIDYFAFTENHVCIVGGNADRKVLFVGNSSNSDMAIQGMTDINNSSDSWLYKNFYPQSCGGAFEDNGKLYVVLSNNDDYIAGKGIVDVTKKDTVGFEYYYKNEVEDENVIF